MKIRDGELEVDVVDALCPFRACYWPARWVGNIVKGAGYRYAPESAWHWRCEENAQRGCPDPLPEPNPEKARCCHAPSVRNVPRGPGGYPRRQRCLSCGKWISGWVLDAVRAGRIEARHPCTHTMAEQSIARPGWYECPSYLDGCRGAWDHRPEAYEHPQATFDDLYPPTEPER